MKKNNRFLLGLLMWLCCFFLTSVASSQDIGAAYWFKKGINEKDQNKKIEFYEKAIQENPEFVEAHYNLALSYLQKKELDKAESAFKKALAANPNAALKINILSRLGSTYRKLARYAEAEESFQGALALSTDNKFKALTLYDLGQTKISQGQYEAAVSYFRQGMRISPDDRSTFETGIQLAKDQQKVSELYQQGLQLIKNNKLSEAREIFNQIIALKPDYPGAKQQIDSIGTLMARQKVTKEQIQPLYSQAKAYLNEGNWAEAIKNLEKIKSLQPDFADIDKLLSQAQEKLYEQLLNTQKVDNLYAMGVENFEKGNYTVALAQFEKVAELDPKYKDIESRLQSTRKEANRVNELMSKMPNRQEANLAALDDNLSMEFDASSSMSSSAQQLFSEKSRELNAAVDSQLVQNYYQEALDLMQQQEWQRAMILLEKIRLIKPNYKSTEFLLAQVRQNLEITIQPETDESGERKATPPLWYALALGVLALPITFLLASPLMRARYYIMLKRYDKAREIYERMLSKKPNNVKLYITLANIYINENRIDEVAIRVFERAIQYNDHLKLQLEPIVSKYYLQKSKSSDTPTKLIQGALMEELKRMGK